ncbi:metallophosphoesterase family protein [Mesobacillus foraminis]|uniref:3',5'-cyclic AMP phosphodiesterase CpdA n=1 Tax=Mesobacillus foraminis TaxID=279826 RepID=A0A4R2AZX3_9BACI|nr:metallophosphoesterase [Mesobacillus foraminis]TCN19718.1 3',5'-cyclic AMP phosphodiesterase CpdA [Mesobacillus foraminis]
MTDKKNPEEEVNWLQGISPNENMNRRGFLQKTTLVVGAAMGATLVNSLPGFPVMAASSSAVGKAKGRKPDIVFPVISDVHIKSNSNDNLDKFVSTLEQLNEIAPMQDAFVVVGDLTENGHTEEYDKFFSVYNARRQTKAASLVAIGNHDYWNGLAVQDAQKRFLEKSSMESIYYHKVIKGYHFIVLGTEDGVTEGTFSVKQIEWMADKLKQANSDDPKKPIFVFHHQPIMGTVYGSEWGFSENRNLFYDTLKAYPQVISFSGHTHYPLDDPRIIHQKDFTSIGTSTGAYLWLDAGRVQGEVPEGVNVLNQALIVEVYNNKVLINRRDIHNNDWTGEPFEISQPAKKNKFIYTDDRDKKAPFFTKDAMISLIHDKTTAASLAVMFSQAKDDLLVHDYKMTVVNMGTGKIEKEILGFSEFYKDPVPNPITLPIDGLKPDTLYEIKVIAIDAFGNESNSSLRVLGKTLMVKEKVNI